TEDRNCYEEGTGYDDNIDLDRWSVNLSRYSRRDGIYLDTQTLKSLFTNLVTPKTNGSLRQPRHNSPRALPSNRQAARLAV
ncbi:MAG: hypothetical protein WBF64_14890, partial [Xanthobacteraceae bacterium]